MKTLTICGSMRFAEEMKRISFELEARQGYNVLQCVYLPEGWTASEEERVQLSRTHYQKIDLSDGIYVVDINGYIGEAVRQEIAYAERNGKEVLYHSQSV